jgi:tetratricopeptide (TPR) repeat protein
MKFYQTIIVFICLSFDVVLAQQAVVSDLLIECFSLPDVEVAKPTEHDLQYFKQIDRLIENELTQGKKLSRNVLTKIEEIIPKMQSPASRGHMVIELINHYAMLEDRPEYNRREIERLVDAELNKPDVDEITLLRAINVFVVMCHDNKQKCKNLLQNAMRHSALTSNQKFYLRGRYALLCETEEKIKIICDMQKEFPNKNSCLAVFLDQVAHSLVDQNPEKAFILMSKIVDIYPQFFAEVGALKNFIYFAEKVNKLDSATKLASKFVQSEPNHPDSQYIFYKLGHLYFELGEYQKSMDSYQKVIDFPIQDTKESRSLSSTAKTNYAVAYSKLNKTSFAPYDDIGKEFKTAKLTVARLFFIITGSTLILIWLILFIRKTINKT